jgi:hypothetical protein
MSATERFHCPRALADPFLCVRGLGRTDCVYCSRSLPLSHPTEISTRAAREGSDTVAEAPIIARHGIPSAKIAQWKSEAEAGTSTPQQDRDRLLAVLDELDRLRKAFAHLMP